MNWPVIGGLLFSFGLWLSIGVILLPPFVRWMEHRRIAREKRYRFEHWKGCQNQIRTRVR